MVTTDISFSVRTGSYVNHAPSVSVILPAYNTASLISEALDSVLVQTYRNFEMIVINDGSLDTEALEQALTPYLERIVYVSQRNRGPAGARNTGIRRARGEFLAFLDSDDSWTCEYLASQVKLFEQDPSLDMVYSDAFFYPDSQSPGKRYMDACPSRGPATLEALVLEQCHVPISCTVARKQTILDCGLFDETLPRCDDYDMWLRMACRGAKISYHQNPLGWVRPGRVGSLGQSEIEMHKAGLQILTKLEKSPALWPAARAVVNKAIAREQALIDLECAKLSLAIGEFDDARGSLIKANTFFQRPKLRFVILGLRLAPRRTAVGGRIWNHLRSMRERHSRQCAPTRTSSPLTAR